MLKFISKLGLGDPCATNVQIINNASHWPITIKIKSGGNIWTENISIGETKRINATRDEIGEVTAHTTVTYANGRILEYSFRIDPKYCEDNVIVRDDHAEYNSEKRGIINKENELKYLAQQQAIKDAEEKVQKEKENLIRERKEAEEKIRKEKDKLAYERKEAKKQQDERDKKLNELKQAALKERERADREIKELERLSAEQRDSIASLIEQQMCHEAEEEAKKQYEEEARKQFEEEMRLKYIEFQEKLKKEKNSVSTGKFDYKQDVGLENLTAESLRNICLKKNISTNGLTTKQDFINKINQYLKSQTTEMYI